MKRQASLSIQEKQLQTLRSRQDEYKRAALQAKAHDDKQLALNYLRVVKGINPMIHAATNGLPVDMNQLPPPPSSYHRISVVSATAEDVTSTGTEGGEAMSAEERMSEFAKIVTELQTQVKGASDNAASYKKVGDVKNAFMYVWSS